MDVERRQLGPQHYVYVDVVTPMDAIGEAMGPAFAKVFGHLAEAGITPRSMPMSVYSGMSDPLRFRVGAIVSDVDAARAASPLAADILPSEALFTTHVGPYSELGQTHQALWSYMEDESIPALMPVWEIYVDDPGRVEEGALRTEIYRALV